MHLILRLLSLAFSIIIILFSLNNQNFAVFMGITTEFESDDTSLISLGCKVVQISRDSYFYLVTSRNLHLAKQFAEISK